MNEREQSRAQELADALDEIGVTTPHQALLPVVQNAIDFLRALADRPEPAQPAEWYDPNDLIGSLRRKLAEPAQPVAHGFDVMYSNRVCLVATALVQWWERAKSMPLPSDWNAFLGKLQNDLVDAVNAPCADAVPPSHPAPSEAAPERQEKS